MKDTRIRKDVKTNLDLDEGREVDSVIEKALKGLDGMTTRRGFLKLTGIAAAGLFASSALGTIRKAYAVTQPLIILERAKGLIIADATRCVGCRRCESACTEFNDGKAQPYIARVKVARNLNFGPKGAQFGFWRREGQYGNLRIIQDTCKQCPHPVPCSIACPNDAIEVAPKTNARVVNEEKCVGCGMCAQACPWEMITVDPESFKAQKCTLCGGQPECVGACPTGALRYIAWRDMTKNSPVRSAGTVGSPGRNTTESCKTCH